MRDSSKARKVQSVKANLLESQFPYFEDFQITNKLEEFNWDVRRASYELALMKSMDDAVSLGPLEVDSNSDFWKRLANTYRPIRTKGLQRGDG